VKNGEVIDSPVPEILHPYLETYLRQYRPVLLKGDIGSASSLWINCYGTALAYTALRPLFNRMGIRLIGRPMSVHSTRHAYATTTLSLDARDIEVAGAGLAHSSTSSVNRYYDRSGTGGVSKTWLKVIGRRRRFG
jgi:site-specific recombinase XerD